MTDNETYNINKDFVWGQIHDINNALEQNLNYSDRTYLIGMLRVWESVISEGESVPELNIKRK